MTMRNRRAWTVSAGNSVWPSSCTGYISHHEASQTLTLAFASLPGTDDYLELLASSPTSNKSILVDLPSTLFPREQLPRTIPQIHHSNVPFLETVATPAILSVLDFLESPPIDGHKDPLRALYNSFGDPSLSSAPQSIRRVEIVGHGLGAAIGLLTALALYQETIGPASKAYSFTTSPRIGVTLFGLPRVGDHHFASYVDSTVLSSQGKLRFNRVTSFGDTIARLPDRHLDLVHPTIGEIWVDADPRMVYACKGEPGMESDQCSASIRLPKTSLLDHFGPFGGVWVGQEVCEGRQWQIETVPRRENTGL